MSRHGTRSKQLDHRARRSAWCGKPDAEGAAAIEIVVLPASAEELAEHEAMLDKPDKEESKGNACGAPTTRWKALRMHELISTANFSIRGG
jgi:hypothetical protein